MEDAQAIRDACDGQQAVCVSLVREKKTEKPPKLYDLTTLQREANRLFLSRQTLNSAFKQLRKKGLVILEPYEENQRSKQAFLTDAGKAYVEEYVLQMHRIEENAWKQMSEEEQMLLTETTRKFSDLIRKELEVSKANMMRSSSEGLRPQP